MPGAPTSLERWQSALRPLLADPSSAAVLTDLDGTLAPIVARPELVVVPDRARFALERIATRFALCAVVTGRRCEVARELVGIEAISYAGNHGFELLEPGASGPSPNPALAGHGQDVARFVTANVDLGALDRVGVRFEDKGAIVAFHWRGSADEPAAETAVAAVAAVARAADLVTHRGRKVLELRPSVRIDKGVAIGALLEGAGASAALYAGDDRTDLDGFEALARMCDIGHLDSIVRVGVRSPEGPAELIEASELAVDDTDALVDLLEILAG